MQRSTIVLAVALAAGCGNPSGFAAEKDGSAPDARTASGRSLAMPVPRAAHSAVALADGRILLIGGCVAESCESGAESATVDAFHPRSRTFKSAGALTIRRVGSAAVQLASGNVLIAGGWAGSSVSASVELFDPDAGASRRAGNLPHARADIAAVTLNDGRVLLAGGYGEGRAKADVDIFDPANVSIEPAGDLVIPRAGAGAALLADGRVLIVGGGTTGPGGLVPTDSSEIFDPATRRSSGSGRMAQARYKHATVRLGDGRVLVLGGSDQRDAHGKLDSVEVFDPRSCRFRPAGRMLEARYKLAGAVVVLPGGRVLIAGGGSRAELYDPSTSRSTAVGPDFGRRLNFPTATLLPDGSVLIAGGYDEDGIRINGEAWIIPAPELPSRTAIRGVGVLGERKKLNHASSAASSAAPIAYAWVG